MNVRIVGMKTDGWEGWGEEKPHKSMSGGLDILACDATLEVHEQTERTHFCVLFTCSGLKK